MNTSHHFSASAVTVKPGYDDVARSVWEQYESHAPQRAREIIALIAPFVNVAACQLLDLGCGYAGTTAEFARAATQAVGVEPDEDKLRLGGGREFVRQSGARLLRSVAEWLPFRDAAFDIVICNDVIEHVQSHERAVAEISRVLKSGGVLYLTAPNRLALRYFWSDPHYHLFGTTILPRAWAAWYVVHVRQRSPEYEVGAFPIPSRLMKLMERHGLKTLSSGMEAVEQKMRAPENIVSPRKARLFRVLQRCGALPLLQRYYRFLARHPDWQTCPVFIARKM
jgi:SAM-dependent methyltransferase